MLCTVLLIILIKTASQGLTRNECIAFWLGGVRREGCYQVGQSCQAEKIDRKQ